MAEVEQLIGREPHRREDADDALALPVRGRKLRCNSPQALGIRDRRATELHHDDARLSGRACRIECGPVLVVGREHGQSVGRGSDRAAA